MADNIITLRSEQRGSDAKIAVSRGFNCFSFRPLVQEEPVEVLWSDPAFPGGGKASHSGIPILFPFPGRIGQAKFQFEGKDYSLTPSDPFGNAIHGFALDRPWRVVDQDATFATGQFQASVDAPEVLERWPSDFVLTVKYTLAGNRLVMDVEVLNPGQGRLPFGFGTHPYFRVPIGANGKPDDCVVAVPSSIRWELKDMLPTGKTLPLGEKETLTAGLAFGGSQFDDVLTDLQFTKEGCTTSIVDPSNTNTLVMTFDGAFTQCVVYNPPHRQAICIEPYSCVPDFFALSQRGIETGMKVLEPNEKWTARIEIRLDQRLGVDMLPE